MVVGKTKLALRWRLDGYIASARRDRKRGRRLRKSFVWILQLMRDGVRPAIRELEQTDVKNWKSLERFYIEFWRRANPGLLNEKNGGDGPDLGRFKKTCDIHGCRRKRFPSGLVRCPKCHAANGARWRGTESGKVYGRTHARNHHYTPKGQSTSLAYRKSKRGRATLKEARIKYRTSAKWKATVKRYRQTEKYKARHRKESQRFRQRRKLSKF
jgi:hypothetical protein